MIVIRADELGFCGGVRRAVDMARKLALESGKRVYTLGSLVHNETVTRELSSLGVECVSESDLASPGARARFPGSIVIIRTHGTTPAVISLLSDLGARVVDATCPRVAASHRIVEGYAARGLRVVVAGDRGHAETIGLLSRAPDSMVAGNALEAAPADPSRRVGLVAQTTISRSEYGSIAEELGRRGVEFEKADTICPVTAKRGEAVHRLCARVDAVVVAGGSHSANTARLAALARAEGKPAFLVESADDLPAEISSYRVVGLAAGASTPDSAIDGIEERLRSVEPGGMRQ